jgi:hypothetical protein
VLDQLAGEHADYFAVISYHAWWPSSSDPYYQYNIPENTGRINYYGADYTPHLWLDGDVDGQWLSGGWENLILDEADVPSPMVINLVVDHDEASSTGTIDAVISATEVIEHTNLKVHFAITESNLPPHGYYTEPINHAMRDMIPTHTGTSLSISQGDVVTEQVSYDMTDFVMGECQIIAFVQSDTDKRVLQAAMFDMPGPHVTVYPTGSLSVPKGGTLYFSSLLQNFGSNPASGDFWLSVRLPSGAELVIPETYVNLDNPMSGQIPAFFNDTATTEIYTPPSGIGTGTYGVVGKIGIYPNTVIESSSFDFIVTN